MKTIDAEKFLSALERMIQKLENEDNRFTILHRLTLDAVAAAARMAMVEDTEK